MKKYIRGLGAIIIALVFSAGIFIQKGPEIQVTCPEETDWQFVEPMNYRSSHSITLCEVTEKGDFFHVIGGYANDTITSRILTYDPESDIYDSTNIPSFPYRSAGGFGFILGDTMYYGGGTMPAWNDQNSPNTDSLIDISYPSLTRGYISTAKGKLLSTTNSGEVWSEIIFDTTYTAQSVKFINDLTGWVLMSKDTTRIMYTTNGGISWQQSFYEPGIRKMEFSETGEGWMGGSSGKIYKRDSFNNWIPQQTGFSSSINAITSIGSGFMWAACDSGKVLKTSDGGISWAQYTVPAMKLTSIKFIDEVTGFAGSDAGGFYKTENGGINWTAIDIGTNQSINDIEILNDTSIAAVGGKGFMVSSKDGGNSWEPRRGITGKDISSISKDGTIIGGLGRIIKSTNGNFKGNISNSLYRLNLSNKAGGWVLGAPLPLQITDALSNCEELNDSLAYIVGGTTKDNKTLSSVYCFNSKTNSWTTGTPLPDSLALGGLAVLNDSTFVFAGGKNSSTISSRVYYGNVRLSTGKVGAIDWSDGGMYPSGAVYGMASSGIKGVGIGLFAGGSTRIFPEQPISDAYLFSSTKSCPVPIDIRIAQPVVTSSTDGSEKPDDEGGTMRGTDTLQYYFHLFGGIEDSLFTSNNTNRRLFVTDYDTTVSVQNISTEIPKRYDLLQNFPNPFNPETNITYDIMEKNHTRLEVYDISGRMIGTLVNEIQQPGRYNVNFKGSSLPSGIYIYRLISGKFTASKRMVLVK